MSTLCNFHDIPDRLAVEEFWELFGKIEHEELDFKKGVSDSILSTIPAMAMTNGGIIVHGVTNDRAIVGCPRSQNTVNRITQRAHECGIEVETRSITVGETELTLTYVPEIRGRIVTSPDGRLLIRSGEQSSPLRGDALAWFVRARMELSGEDEPVRAFSPSDLDLSSLNQALESDQRAGVGLDKAWRALSDLGVAKVEPSSLDTTPLRAAVVLFGAHPERFLPRVAVQLVRREGVGPGPGPTLERKEISGPLAKTLELCLRFVTRHTRQFEVVVGATRDVLPEYPTPVLREAIVNALAHRDYNLTGTTIDITIWDDRLEIQSPGPLPAHITVDNIRREHYSRNPRIMRILKTLRLVEEYGEGVDRMYREMEARLMESPTFSDTGSSVKVTLLNRSLVDVEAQVWLSLLAGYRLTPRERFLLVTARGEGSLTPRRVREWYPAEDATAILKSAVAKGLFIRVGERGGTRYVLSDEVVLRVGATSMEAQNRKQQALLDELNRLGSISTAEGARLLGEDRARVRNLLNDLVRGGLARAEGRTRARRYHRA